ncbi:MAG: hypothetical protein LBC53_06800 [Spirochaetaceae bacterium]|nr:hypothetical protein [Spirochaetaceae bacterium]
MKTKKTPVEVNAGKRGLRLVFFLLSFVFYLLAGCDQEQGGQADIEPQAPSVNIEDAEDLKKIGKVTGYPLNGRYTLTADITVSGWSPLTQTSDFSGVFDGAGRTITITGGTGGLFMYADGATVRNLAVNVTAVVTAADDTGAMAGGIVGFAKRTLIENCTAVVDLTVTGKAHNSSAGGIVGAMGSSSTVRNCAASGKVELHGDGFQLMVYAGGVAGYSGTPGSAGTGASGCLIERSRWTSGTVSAESPFPYAGGVVGYNYTGAAVKRCWAAGSVKARGANLPYAGGVAGYNSGYVRGKDTPSVIENCYSTAAVEAESTSKAALAGGVAGSNAKGALISKCYAAGAVTARVAGNGAEDIGGSIGPMAAASAGGIAGAQYYYEESPAIEYCAALNPAVNGADTAAGAVWNIYRIAGAGTPDSDNTTNARVYYRNNIAYSGMTVTRRAGTVASDANGRDGADCEEKPAQAVFEGLGWDFGGVWKMDDGGRPAL